MVRDVPFESARYYSQEEFEDFALDNQGTERLQLLNGRVVMEPPAGWPATEVGVLVSAALLEYVRSRHLGRVLGSDQGVELPSGDTVSPDASFVSSATWSATAPHREGKFLRLVPELVVEVLSPTSVTYDRGEKKGIYERNGVREYWILDPVAQRAWLFVLTNGKYGQPTFVESDGELVSTVLPGFSRPLRELLPTD